MTVANGTKDPQTHKIMSINARGDQAVETRFAEGRSAAQDELGQVAATLGRGERVRLIDPYGEVLIELECVRTAFNGVAEE